MNLNIDTNSEFYSKELKEDQIGYYVKIFQAMDCDMEDKLKFSLFKNKFAIFNYIKVASRLGYPRNKVFINDLMTGLQDANWPFFDELLHFFKEAYPIELLTEIIDKYLVIADEEEDYMWIAGLASLVDYLELDINLLNNKMLLAKRDF